jgi:shikimate dehydrogenase
LEQDFPIVQQNIPTMYFIGVTTGQSSIMRLFPLWAEVLGLKHAQLIGVDLPLHAAPEQYRQVVAQIKNDPLSLNEDPQENDRLMAELPPGSLVINATGMGKDRPGSPITGAGVFPTYGIAWELNYRGKLDFLHQALAQWELRHLTVHDGWCYFIISWVDHIAEVFHIKVTPEQFDQLAGKAEMIRG